MAQKHLGFIRSLPCVVCGYHPVDAAHVRYGSVEMDKKPAGMGQKPDDRWTVPLCRRCHELQHSMNEQMFWCSWGLDPLSIAGQLFSVSGDYEEGWRIIRESKGE